MSRRFALGAPFSICSLVALGAAAQGQKPPGAPPGAPATATATASQLPPAPPPPTAAPPPPPTTAMPPPPATAPPGYPPPVGLQPQPPPYGYPPGYPPPSPYQPYPPGYAPPGYAPPGYASPYGPPRVMLPPVIEDHGQPTPAGYRAVSTPRSGPVVAGWIVFGIFYGITFMAASDTRDGGALYVPVVGPLLYRGKTDNEGSRLAAYYSFVGQTTGAALLLAGYAFPRKTFVLEDPAAVHVSVSVAPIVGKGTEGLAAIGTF